MQCEILQLKKLNAAYAAALEYDYCPTSEKAVEIYDMFDTGVDIEELKTVLDENSGRRPDEIANEMSDTIKKLRIL